MKYSICAPGTFHAFDIAEQLHKEDKLEKIYTYADFLRVVKWKKKVPLSRCDYYKYPLIKFGGLNRKHGAEIIARKVEKDESSVVYSMAGIAEPIFIQNINKLKILDIDHYTWPNNFLYEQTQNLREKAFVEAAKQNKNIMQHFNLYQEHLKRRSSYIPSFEQIAAEIREVQLADLVVVPVSYVKNAMLLDGVPSGKIKIIPYGYDSNIFANRKNKKREYVLYGGSISIRKGWFYLREIIKDCVKEEIKIEICGGISAELRSDVLHFFNENRKYVKYHGAVTQIKLAEKMNSACCFIFPSVLEGFGMPIIQAMACGAPVVVSKNTCGEDLVVNGENGFKLNLEDNWIDYIKKIIGNQSKIKEMGENAEKTVASCTWANYVQELSDYVLALEKSR